MEKGGKLQLEEKPHHLTNEGEAFGMLRKAAAAAARKEPPSVRNSGEL